MSDEPDRQKGMVTAWALALFAALAVYFGVHCATAHQIWYVDGATGKVLTVYYTHKTLGLMPTRLVDLFFWPAEKIDRVVRKIPAAPKR
ncbi:MAG TPA: hypothetical protein VG055_09520 [Planctomycetaceae bacterium]|jgi:hypothetical protein|nr:hypothetical protein [Planctomycetaceae bacterium]